MSHAVYPLVISLPDGSTARVRITHVVEVNDKGEETLTQLVSTPPQYERRDGTTVALDVEIPDDLVAAGWHWHGTTLRWPADDPLRGMAIMTDSYPPPPYPSERGSCFDAARRFEAMRETRHEQHVAERVRKATKTPKPKKDAPVIEAVQLELF